MGADPIQQAGREAEHFADEQKKAGASRLDHLAKAVHGAADELNDDMPKTAELVHAAASRLEQGAGVLRERGVGDLLDEAGAFGRREPLALFGGAVAAGFAISRLLKGAAKSAG